MRLRRLLTYLLTSSSSSSTGSSSKLNSGSGSIVVCFRLGLGLSLSRRVSILHDAVLCGDTLFITRTSLYRVGQKVSCCIAGIIMGQLEDVLFATYLQNVVTLPCKMANNDKVIIH